MKIVKKVSIPKETCYDISVQNTNCFFANGVLVHNSNAGIRIFNNEVLPQSRTQFIDEKNDNAGFARWVNSNIEYWRALSIDKEITVYGEWCGPGIMKGTAINKIPNKVFAVFAIMIGSVNSEEEENSNTLIVEPSEIETILKNKPKDVYVISWEPNSFEVSFSKDDLQKTVDSINKLVEQTEPCDPWIKETFNVEGISEGIVYYPIDTVSTRKLFSNLAFKAKGEQHKVVATKQSVQIDPEVAKSIDEFANLFVTPQRVEQGKEFVGSYDMKLTGNFLKWFLADVKKESVAELETSQLSWEDVSSVIQNKARLMFVTECKKV